MNETPKNMSSKRNVIILVIVLAVLIVGGIIAAVAVGTSGKTDIAETLTLAERYLDEENYEQAIIEFEKILEIDPMNVDAYIGKAEALIALGDIDGAIALLEEAYELTGDEDIKEMLDELTTEPIVTTTTTAATTTTAETTTTATTTAPEPEEIVWNDPECLAIEQMLYDHFNNGGELKAEMLAEVTSLKIYGNEIFCVECGNRKGTEAYAGALYIAPKKITIKYSDETEVTVTEGSISDISFIEHAKSLERLEVFCNNISDISPLAEMTQLTNLLLDGNNISDISPLADMTQLETLELIVNNISDISPLADMTQLTYLYLSSNNISDISPLAGMAQLTVLGLGDNNISDISPLAEMTRLTYLSLDGNNIPEAQITEFQATHPDCNINY